MKKMMVMLAAALTASMMLAQEKTAVVNMVDLGVSTRVASATVS